MPTAHQCPTTPRSAALLLALQSEALRGDIAQRERECRALEAALRRLLVANADMSRHFRSAGSTHSNAPT